MKPHHFTTILNLKIILTIVLLLFTITSYTHLISQEKEDEENLQYMIAITDFIIEKKPPNLFLLTSSDLNKPHSPEELATLHQQLQPIIKNIFMPIHQMKFGFISDKDNRVIALGPGSDPTILSGLNTEQIDLLHQGGLVPKLLDEKRSLLWYGAEAKTYIRPITENNILVGYAFASVNQNNVRSDIWHKTINTFLGIFVMMLVSIIIFREIFIKLKHDLHTFAEAIVSGNYDKCRTEFTEFNSVLDYISNQTKKMTRLERLNIVGEMAAGIAHEIRNPMTTVRGLLQFIGRKPEFIHQKENFDLMIDELDRANQIITEFLSLSKNKSFAFKEENLNTIINDILPLLQSNVLYHNSVLHLNLKPLPSMILDRNSMRQLVLNMVKNGLDAMPGGGTISIDTLQEDDQVFLNISDTGTGIPKEIKENLGTPFFTTKESGTGLGLAICFRIVQRHSAVLKIKSEPGEGTTFTIIFTLQDISPDALAKTNTDAEVNRND